MRGRQGEGEGDTDLLRNKKKKKYLHPTEKKRGGGEGTLYSSLLLFSFSSFLSLNRRGRDAGASPCGFGISPNNVATAAASPSSPPPSSPSSFLCRSPGGGDVKVADGLRRGRRRPRAHRLELRRVRRDARERDGHAAGRRAGQARELLLLLGGAVVVLAAVAAVAAEAEAAAARPREPQRERRRDLLVALVGGGRRQLLLRGEPESREVPFASVVLAVEERRGGPSAGELALPVALARAPARGRKGGGDDAAVAVEDGARRRLLVSAHHPLGD